MAELLDEIYEICLEKPDMWPDHRNVEQFAGEIAAELDRREAMTRRKQDLKPVSAMECSFRRNV